jgi:L-aminopeptidase/D-esterase-like protein
MDGDVVFAASTAAARRTPSHRDLLEIGAIATDCVARAIARAVYEASALRFPGALPAWKDKFANARNAGRS